MNLKRILFLLAAVLPLQLSAKVTLPGDLHRQHGAAATERCENLGQGQTRQGRESHHFVGRQDLRGDGLRIGRLGGARVDPRGRGPYTVTVSDGKPVD